MKDRRRVARQVLEGYGVVVRGDGDLEPTATRLQARGRLLRRFVVLGTAVLLVTGPAGIADVLPGPLWLAPIGTLAGVLLALAAPHLLPDRSFAGDLAAPLLNTASRSDSQTAAPASSPGARLLEAHRQNLQLSDETAERLTRAAEVREVAAGVRRTWRRFELFRAAVVAGLGGLLLRDVWAGTDATWAVVTAVAILLALWLGLERVRERAAAALAPRLDGD